MPTQATIRRDPRNTGKGISTHHGFTVIELMISLAVLAIITSLALPSYRTILEKRQVTSGAEQLGAFLSSAQLESVKRNQFVAVNYNANGGNWCFGMRAGDADSVSCDCIEPDSAAGDACALDGALKVFNSSVLNYPGVLSSATLGGDADGDADLVYDPVRGLILGADTAKLELVSDDGRYASNVEVTVTGRVKICNPTSGKEVPGYGDCTL
ncbi:MAG: GspH/FimT family pseudopilin [Lysobacterales bacterium]